jgi:tRNA(fMet)-specific endonuclease VapC
MYLLDTNTLIYFFRGMGKVAENLLSKSPKNIAIPSIVLYELEVGIAKSTTPGKRAQQLESLVSRVTVFPFGAKEAKFSAKIRADLESRGESIGPNDNLIAGIAVCTRSTLVTHNTNEFNRVKNLSVEDWY